MEAKRPFDSLTIMNEMVLPNDTNTLNNLMGGRLLHWMDICAAMAAQKHARTICVTASVNNVSFSYPIKLGNVVTLQARVVRSFNTSMEVYIEVWMQDLRKDERLKCNDAFYTFVALDDAGNKVKVPPIIPFDENDKELYDYALLRKQLKLLSSGKIILNEAPELKKQLQQWIEGNSTGLAGHIY